MSHSPDNPPESKKNISSSVDFFSGAASGVICAVLFHPWDRAVYVSTKHNVAFLLRGNFHTPYHGVLQAVVQRGLLGSAYYVVQGQMRSHLIPYMRDELGASVVTRQISIGIAAGSMHGAMTNCLAVVKAYTWGDKSRTFTTSAVEMYQKNGLNAFNKGLLSSVLRDSTHGVTYEVCRNFFRRKASELQSGEKRENSKLVNFTCDTVAAGIGTTLSAPFNHARAMKYATPLDKKPPGIVEVWKNTLKEAKQHDVKISKQASYLFHRVRIGPGTIRASVGMAAGQFFFDQIRTSVNNISEVREGNSHGLSK